MSRLFPPFSALFAFALAATPAVAAQFSPDTLSVLRVNAGVATTTAASASIVEINKVTGQPTGYTVDLATPTAVSTATGITLDWNAINPTQLHRSTDGTALTFPGYTNLLGSSITGSKRSFATVTADGTASYQTSLGAANPYTNGSPTAFVTTGASHYLGGVATNQGGLRYGNNAANPSAFPVTQVYFPNTSVGVRDVNIFGSGTNQRLFFTDRNNVFVANPSGALPTGAATASFLPAVGSQNICGFYLLDRNPTVDFLGTGTDTLYFAEGGANFSEPILRKFEYNATAGTWIARGSYMPPSFGASGRFGGLTAEIDGLGVALYATEANTGLLARINDASAFGANISATEAWTLSPTAGTGYRGVDFSPIPEPSSLVLLGFLAIGGARVRRKPTPNRLP